MKQRNKNRIWKQWLAVGISILQIVCLPGLTAIAAPPADAAEAGYKEVYTQTFDVKPAELTEKVRDTEHYARWQDGVLNIYNGDGQGADVGELRFPETYSQDGLRVAMTVLRDAAEGGGAAHSRLKLFLVNEDGSRPHQFSLTQRTEGLLLTTANNSMIDAGLKRSQAAEPLRLEMEFNFTDGTIAYRTALIEEENWVWSSWTAAKEPEAKDGEAVLDSLAGIQFSNEYALCNITVDDIRISVPDGEEPDEPEPEPAPGFPMDEAEAGYEDAYIQRFDAKPEELTDAAGDGSTHYSKWQDGAVSVYNAANSADAAALALPDAYTQDGLRVAMTIVGGGAVSDGAKHARMKLFFVNSSGKRAHQVFLLLDEIQQGDEKVEKMLVTDKSSTQFGTDVKHAAPGEPMRIEMEFDFTENLIRYRTALLNGEAWEWSDWTAGKAPEAQDSGSVLDSLAGIRFSNEYTACNITVDDIRISMPTGVPEIGYTDVQSQDGHIRISGVMLANAPESGCFLIAAGYDRDGMLRGMAEVTDGTAVLPADGVSAVKIFGWNSIEGLQPICDSKDVAIP